MEVQTWYLTSVGWGPLSTAVSSLNPLRHPHKQELSAHSPFLSTKQLLQKHGTNSASVVLLLLLSWVLIHFLHSQTGVTHTPIKACLPPWTECPTHLDTHTLST